jgi:hypothetical protein
VTQEIIPELTAGFMRDSDKDLDRVPAQIVLPATDVSDLKVGQPVLLTACGIGKVAEIDGGDVTVRFADTEKKVSAQALVTRAQAEVNWRAHWLPGAERRREEGRRLWIVKELCTFGEWQDFLDRFDLSRSTCDDLIRRYKNEVTWEAQDQHLTGNRSSDETEPTTVADPDRHVSERTPDPDGDARKELVGKEAEKRQGTPRIANRLLHRARDFAQVRAQGHITLAVAQEALQMLGVDEHGLDDMGRKLMLTIIQKYAGGPVGVNTLAASLGVNEGIVRDIYEPYLMKLGLLDRTQRGRVATALAYKHFGMELPRERR